ncbi:MAG TPA: PAS domain-containing sensor histidine kinase [Burkholderiales bacterium]|nr:PAS domain-containing sensor histidine kinase [Burkholderiales bacterium]
MAQAFRLRMIDTTLATGAARADLSPAVLAAQIRDRADPRLVLADRVEQLYSQLPLGMVTTIAIGFIAAVELREGRFIELVLFWSTLLVVVVALHAVLYLRYRREADKLAQAPQWLRWLGIGAFAAGAVWGFAAAVFFPSHTDERQVFLAFLLSGAISGGIPIYAASWPIFAAYAAAIALPFTYVLATFGNRLFAEIALLIPLFYGVTVAIAYRLNSVFFSGYRLRHAYGRLTEDYSVLNRRLEKQLVELDEARRQVEASGRKLALFAERAPIAVLELAAEGTVTQVNQAAELLFGYAAAELIGGSVKRLVLPQYEADFDRQWAQLLATRMPMAGLKIRNLRRDGISIVCEWTVTPLVNPEGTIISIIAQGRDITAQLEAERMKKEFTSTLSHELRTPLTSIIGSLQLINAGVLGEVPKDVAELTDVAERNGQRLLDLINDILDIEKIESGKLTLAPETLRIDQLVQEAMVLNKGFADRFKVRFEPRGALVCGEVRADHKRLLQVMTNLLSNAAKFSPEGQVVEISTETRDAALRVAIHDHGPGIPEAFRPRLFGRFSQADSTASRQKGGTGLGLAISKRLIEMMEGKIGFEDRPGGGTTFWFELPCLSAR